MENLRELFLEELADLYHAERQLVKMLPQMANAASTPELREAFESHLEETEDHVSRLEEVFELLGREPKAEKCPAMEGIVEEGKKILKDHPEGVLRDAALIASAQKAEHYEIATYGTLCTWAKLLEENEALDLLKETMEDEKAADEHLTEIAETAVNTQAAETEED